MPKKEQLWFFHFKQNKTYGHLRIKCLKRETGFGYPPFSLDQAYYDSVDIEEFNLIEDDRIPFFVGMAISGVSPRMEKIPGFFNGRKMVMVISKSSFNSLVGGVSIYECENGLRNTLITFRNDQPNPVIV